MPTKQTEQGGFVWVEDVEKVVPSPPSSWREAVGAAMRRHEATMTEWDLSLTALENARSAALLSLIRGTSWYGGVEVHMDAIELRKVFDADDVSDLADLARLIHRGAGKTCDLFDGGGFAWATGEAGVLVLHISSAEGWNIGDIRMFIADYDLRVDWSALKGGALQEAEEKTRLWTERLAVMRALVGEATEVDAADAAPPTAHYESEVLP